MDGTARDGAFRARKAAALPWLTHARTHPQGVQAPVPAAWMTKLSFEVKGTKQDETRPGPPMPREREYSFALKGLGTRKARRAVVRRVAL